jgi:hypothetical protein
MSKRYLLALYNNFEEAEQVVRELRSSSIQGFNAADDMVIKSPIEHPEVEEFIGPKSVKVQWFTLFGALLAGSLGFLWVASTQANFFSQMKGGKPIVPIPPDMVLTYEFFILGGVYITVLGFLICAGLPARRSPLYSAKVSEDQIGIMVKAEEGATTALKGIFAKHKALEIQEEVGR